MSTGLTFLSQSGNKIFIVGARSEGRERQNERVRMTSVSTVYFGDCLQVAGNMAEQKLSWKHDFIADDKLA